MVAFFYIVYVEVIFFVLLEVLVVREKGDSILFCCERMLRIFEDFLLTNLHTSLGGDQHILFGGKVHKE